MISAFIMLILLSGCVKTLKKNTPDGYPYKHVPLYESGNAYVAGASGQSMGDYKSFMVSVETDDAPDVVAAAIKEEFSGEEEGGQSGDVCSLGAVMISGEAGDWLYNITIESLGDSGGTEITYFIKTAQGDY